MTRFLQPTFPNLTREQVRRVDQSAIQELGLPSLLLMENAARGTAELLLQSSPGGQILILCGPGNNGGDGLAICRLLAAHGRSAEALLVDDGKSCTADTEANRKFLEQAGLQVLQQNEETISHRLDTLSPDDWIVDALLGTGLRGAVRHPYHNLIAAANRSPARILAVDLPSGLDCDEGIPAGACIRAQLTATFVARKRGFDRPGSQEWTGTVHVLPIGIPLSWLNDWYARQQHTRQPDGP